MLKFEDYELMYNNLLKDYVFLMENYDSLKLLLRQRNLELEQFKKLPQTNTVISRSENNLQIQEVKGLVGGLYFTKPPEPIQDNNLKTTLEQMKQNDL